jgi:hypothetical protein
MISNRRNMRGMKGQGKRKRQRLVLNQLAWLLVNNRQGVIEAFRDAGFEVDDDATPKKLKGILRRAVLRLKEKRSPKAKALIRNISALILIEEKDKTEEFSNFFKRNKDKKVADGNSDSDSDKDKEVSDQKKGEFLKNNADSIAQIGTAIFGGLFNRGGNEQVDSQMQTYQNQKGFGDEPKKSKTGLIIGIGVGAIAVIGLTAFLIRRSKK